MTKRQFAMQKDQQNPHWSKERLLMVAAAQCSDLRWRNGNTSNASILVGVVRSARINGDWHWHFAEAVAREDAEVTFDVPAGITFGLLYEGELQLELAGAKHHLKANSPLAFCFTNAMPIPLTRKFKSGVKVHKFTLGISRAWLNSMGLEMLGCQNNHKLVTFPASETLMTATNSLLTLPNEPTTQEKFQQISCVTKLLSAVGAALDEESISDGKLKTSQTPATLEQRLLDTVRDIIQRENIHLEDIQVDDIAKLLGSSVSGIQRMAKKCFGQSLLKHIRHAKLANALSAMKERNFTIGEAAFLAGYKQTSNFSLAFRKVYGFAPGEISKVERDHN